MNLQDIYKNNILDTMASIIDSTNAEIILGSIGYPGSRKPSNYENNRLDFWTKICETIASGALSTGTDLQPLMDAIAFRFPSNSVFRKTINTNNNQSKKYDLFISYSRKNTDVIKQIVNEMQNQGLSPWFDDNSINPGDNFTTIIQQDITKAKYIVVFIGNDGFGPWQEAEIDIALDQAISKKCILIPVLLEGVPMQQLKDLKPLLARYQCIQWQDMNDIEDIVGNIKRIVRM
jgi:hypothetical protein